MCPVKRVSAIKHQQKGKITEETGTIKEGGVLRGKLETNRKDARGHKEEGSTS